MELLAAGDIAGHRTNLKTMDVIILFHIIGYL